MLLELLQIVTILLIKTLDAFKIVARILLACPRQLQAFLDMELL